MLNLVHYLVIYWLQTTQGCIPLADVLLWRYADHFLSNSRQTYSSTGTATRRTTPASHRQTRSCLPRSRPSCSATTPSRLDTTHVSRLATNSVTSSVTIQTTTLKSYWLEMLNIGRLYWLETSLLCDRRVLLRMNTDPRNDLRLHSQPRQISSQ